MAINPLIPMQGVTPNIDDAVAQGVQAYQGAQRNALLQEEADAQAPLMAARTEAAQLGLTKEKALFQLGDAAFDAVQIKPLIAAGDARAIQALDRRIEKIRARDGDPSDTIALRDALASGQMKPDQALSELDGVIKTAVMAGVLEDTATKATPTTLVQEADALGIDISTPEGRSAYQQFKQGLTRPRPQAVGGDQPSAIREFEYYQRLSPEQRAEWDRNKRGDKASTATEKQMFDAIDTAQVESVKFTNYSELARQYEQSAGKLASGAFGSVSEWIKEQTGSQDSASLLRKDWAAVKASEVVKNLPPGAASDADVKMALAGFLPNNADPKAVASFLRGVAKLSKINGEYQSFKADYLSENKSPAGMLKAWKSYKAQQPADGSTMSSGNSHISSSGIKFTVE